MIYGKQTKTKILNERFTEAAFRTLGFGGVEALAFKFFPEDNGFYLKDQHKNKGIKALDGYLAASNLNIYQLASERGWIKTQGLNNELHNSR